MSDIELEQLGDDFVYNNIRELTGVEFRHFIERPDKYREIAFRRACLNGPII